MLEVIIGIILLAAGIFGVVHGGNLNGEAKAKIAHLFDQEAEKPGTLFIVLGAIAAVAGAVLIIVGIVLAIRSEKDTKFNNWCKNVICARARVIMLVIYALLLALGVICIVVGVMALQGKLIFDGFFFKGIFQALGDYASIFYIVIGCSAALISILMIIITFVKQSQITTRQLVESALMLASATVLSFIKIDLPYGGGITLLSMLPIIIISHRYGAGWGIFNAFVYSLIQMLFGLDNVGWASTPIMAAGVTLLDYILAYTGLGFSGIFGKKRGSVAAGICVTFIFRFICHFISGAWIWGEWMPDEFMGMTMTSPWTYSALYNGWYMAAELAATLIVAMLIYKPLEKYFTGADIKKLKKD
ncbi:MAG: energy-coupled thiamine transporter ThiT [Clostridia bacterium]|nr:energy-coupled thiamine transporter ThiT [Clostridia bacterium]